MQMTGSGMICNGYFYYNPTVRDYGTENVSSSDPSYPTTFSYSPGIGESPRLKLYNPYNGTQYYRVVFNGTYVGSGIIGTYSMDRKGSLEYTGSTTISTTGARYA